MPATLSVSKKRPEYLFTHVIDNLSISDVHHDIIADDVVPEYKYIGFQIGYVPYVK